MGFFGYGGIFTFILNMFGMLMTGQIVAVFQGLASIFAIIFNSI